MRPRLKCQGLHQGVERICGIRRRARGGELKQVGNPPLVLRSMRPPSLMMLITVIVDRTAAGGAPVIAVVSVGHVMCAFQVFPANDQSVNSSLFRRLSNPASTRTPGCLRCLSARPLAAPSTRYQGPLLLLFLLCSEAALTSSLRRPYNSGQSPRLPYSTDRSFLAPPLISLARASVVLLTHSITSNLSISAW